MDLRRVTAAAVLLLALGAGRARAGEEFWQRVAEPQRERFDRLVRDAEGELMMARQIGNRQAAASAEAKLAEAALLAPAHGDFRAALLLGEARALLGHAADAVTALERARSLARVPSEEAEASFLLGVEKSKLGRYAEAVADYDRQVRLAPADGTTYTNSAELLMSLGRLVEAEDRYREAVRVDSARPDREASVALAYYGLAVALDRDEQPAAAREAMQQALRRDLSLARLLSALEPNADVFFVPEGDVHYYLGFAHEVAGHPEAAAQAFRRFLTAQPKGPWARRAQAHVDALAGPTAAAVVARDGGATPPAHEGPRPGGVPAVAGAGARSGHVVVRAVATVRTTGGVAAPLVDAAWHERPPPLEACFDELAVARDGVRLSLDVTFDGKGAPRRVAVDGPAPAKAAARCVESAVKAALRVPRPDKGKAAGARIEVFLAPSSGPS